VVCVCCVCVCYRINKQCLLCAHKTPTYDKFFWSFSLSFEKSKRYEDMMKNKSIGPDVARAMLTLLMGESPNPRGLQYLPVEFWDEIDEPKLREIVFGSRPFDATSHVLLNMIRSTIGTNVTFPCGTEIRNTRFFDGSARYFQSVSSVVAKGHFGEVTFVTYSKEKKSLVLKRFFDTKMRDRVHDAIGRIKGKSSTSLERFWNMLCPTMEPVQYGYVMFESNEIGRELEWLHSLMDMMVLFGLVHGDLKEENIYQGGLIDWDNVLFQCAGMKKMCMCDSKNYDLKSASVVENEVRNALKIANASKSGLMIYVAACYLYVISSHKIDIDHMLGDEVLNLPQDDVKETREPPFSPESEFPWPSRDDLSSCTICRIEMSKSLREYKTCVLKCGEHVVFPYFGGVSRDTCLKIAKSLEVELDLEEEEEEGDGELASSDDDGGSGYYSLF